MSPSSFSSKGHEPYRLNAGPVGAGMYFVSVSACIVHTVITLVNLPIRVEHQVQALFVF